MSVHRNVEATRQLLSKRIVHVTLSNCVVDLTVTSQAAQEFWCKALQRQDDFVTSPTSATRPKSVPLTRFRASFVHALLERSDQESAALLPNTPLQRNSKTGAQMPWCVPPAQRVSTSLGSITTSSASLMAHRPDRVFLFNPAVRAPQVAARRRTTEL